MRHGELTAAIGDGVPPPRRDFAVAMRDVRGAWPVVPSLRGLVVQLAEAGYPGVGAPSLSRYFSGKDVPAEALVKIFYRVACEAAGRQELAISLPRLLELRQAAEAADGRRGKALHRQPRGLESDLDGARCPVSSASEITSSPVPGEGGDRRNFESVHCGPEYDAASSASGLAAVGDLRGALTILEELPYVLSPAGIAQCYAHLRALGHPDLAVNLLTIYHRRSPIKDVVAVSKALRKGYPEEADRMLDMIV